MFFSLALMIGLSFCSNNIFAQGAQTYEYSTLASGLDSKKVIFMAPDGTIETIEIDKSPEEFKGVTKQYYTLNYSINAVQQ